MPLISKARYQELLQCERELEREDKEDRAARRDYQKSITRYQASVAEEHEDEIHEIKTSHKQELRKLEDATAKKVEDATKKQATAERELEVATETITALNKRVEKESALATREIDVKTSETELSAREKRVAAREKAVQEAEDKHAKTVEKQAKAVADARTEGLEIGEKRGYANGTADMARTIAEQTQKANDKVGDMGDKALDAVVEAAKKTLPDPKVNVLSVPVQTPSTINNSNQQ